MELSIGININRNKGGFDYLTSALTNAMTTEPTFARSVLIDNFFKTIRPAGIVDALDAIYVTAADDSQAATLNWLDPTKFNLTIVGTPTFTQNKGFTGNGTDAYLNTNYTFGQGKATQDNNSGGVWTNSAINENRIAMGTRNWLIYPRNSGFNIETRNNNGTGSSTTFGGLNSLGLVAMSRSSASTYTTYKDGVLRNTLSQTSSTPSAHPVFILAQSGSSGSPALFSNRIVNAAFIGRALTDSQQTTLYNAFNTYLTAVGAFA